MRSLFLMTALTLGAAACTYDDPEVITPDAAPPADAVPPDASDPRLAGYEDDVRAFQHYFGMPPEWTDWMIERKDRFTRAYLYGFDRRGWRIEVRYERQIPYDPPWASEDEHLATLELMAELQYPGWDFTFSSNDPGADVIAYLGHAGVSYASSGEVRLVYEAIFAHEFGHVAGIPHHYCGSQPDDCPEATPPGEGICIMNRRSPTWGPTETFLLQLEPRRADEEVYEVIRSINDRYPEGWQ